ncbi:hypothetical protein [Candidatus Binatus sp.]|uniref:hypothetical protein n=1 Tax=Candidatus Binatus sp. TaxID=2811406 RepID=UPI002F943D78
MSALAKDFDAIIVGALAPKWFSTAGGNSIPAAQMLTPRAAFPSFKFARLMAAASRAA